MSSLKRPRQHVSNLVEGARRSEKKRVITSTEQVDHLVFDTIGNIATSGDVTARANTLASHTTPSLASHSSPSPTHSVKPPPLDRQNGPAEGLSLEKFGDREICYGTVTRCLRVYRAIAEWLL